MTTYLDTVRTALDVELPGLHPHLLDMYSLLVYVKGQQVTHEDVHNAWALWTASSNPNHIYMLPFDELPPDVRDLDGPYIDAIRRVAEAVNVPRETSVT